MNITPERLLDALTGKLPGSDIALLTVELRAVPASSVLSIAAQGGISIEGDGNIVGDNNTSIVVKGEGAAELAGVLRETLERGRMLFQLRPPVADFVGREQEVATLTSALRAGKHAGISGMGGTGKTELALLVASRVRESYPDAQLFINLHGSDLQPHQAKDTLAACIRSLVGTEARLPEGIDELTQIYRNALSGKRALIVLDNAAENSQIRPLQPPEGSVLLVSSRSVLTLTGMTRVSLDQLQPNEARTLLVGIAPHTADEVADAICLLCGYLPLAIRAAGSLLSVSIDKDPADYAQELRDERTRLELIGTEDVDLGIEASFNLSYQRLEPEAAKVFASLAVFPASFDTEAEEEICADPGHVYLSQLLRLSLVLYDLSSKRYRLHDLVRLFADARLGTDERAAGQRQHAIHYLTVLAVAEDRYLRADKRGLTLFDLERRNIEAGHAWAEAEVERNEWAAELCITYPHSGGNLLDLRQHPRERIRWLETALSAARKLQRRDSEGAVLGNLGVAFQHLGEMRKAIELYVQALAIYRDLGNRRSEGTTLANLGLACAETGELGKAIEFYERAVFIHREIENRAGEAEALGNLGAAYRDLGQPTLAMLFLKQAVLIDREEGNRRGEAASLDNLGLAHLDLGAHQAAIKFFAEALLIEREIGDHCGEAMVLFNSSLAMNALDQRALAIEAAEEALTIFEQIEDFRAPHVREQIAKWRSE